MLQRTQCRAIPRIEGGIQSGGGGTIGAYRGAGGGGRPEGANRPPGAPCGTVYPQRGQNSAPSSTGVAHLGQTATNPQSICRISPSRGPLPNHCVAIATRNPALYADLAAWLREQRLPSVSVWPGERLPAGVVAVLTSEEEAGTIRHARVLEASEDGDRTALLAAVRHALAVGRPDDELIVGIDPGPRPGYSVLAANRPIAEGTLENPEAAGRLGSVLRRRFPGHPIRFRVGRGDHLARDRIVNSLVPLRRPVELVDERGTTPRGQRRPRDATAARAIARAAGDPVRGATTVQVTDGEVANLQRLSRLGSGGSFTIPRTLARRVLRGDISFPDAIAEGEARYGARSPPSPRRPHGRAEPS